MVRIKKLYLHNREFQGTPSNPNPLVFVTSGDFGPQELLMLRLTLRLSVFVGFGLGFVTILRTGEVGTAGGFCCGFQAPVGQLAC